MNLKSRIRYLDLISRVKFHSSETDSVVEAFGHFILKELIRRSNNVTREED